MTEIGASEEMINLKRHTPELVAAFEVALENACNELEFDVKCLDWFSYNPDLFIAMKDQKAA